MISVMQVWTPNRAPDKRDRVSFCRISILLNQNRIAARRDNRAGVAAILYA